MNPDWAIRAWTEADNGARSLRVFEVTEVKTEDKNAYNVDTTYPAHPSMSSIVCVAANNCMQSFSQDLLHLTTAYQICGTVCGMLVYGSRFCRLRHGASHRFPIAVEMDNKLRIAANPQPLTVPEFINHPELFGVFPWNMSKQLEDPKSPAKGGWIGDVHAVTTFSEYHRSILKHCRDSKIVDCRVRLSDDAQTVPAFASQWVTAADHITLTRKAQWKTYGSIGSPARRRQSSPRKPPAGSCRPPREATERRHRDDDEEREEHE